MVTQKGSRLSVQPATKREFEARRQARPRGCGTAPDDQEPLPRRRVWSRPRCTTTFMRHRATIADIETGAMAPVPDAAVIESLINTTFWTSLRREEGYVPKLSLAYCRRSRTRAPHAFRAAAAPPPSALARVAPVVERAGIHLGIWPH